uniref:28S ribosomal protein S24, mitochondrial n=1 Tax=Mesocestoides corti TaxID=53468 RepID=A0A5K3ERF0_MESCO
MLLVCSRVSTVAIPKILRQHFAIATIKKHVPLIKFRSRLNSTADSENAPSEEPLPELSFHPSFFRKPLSEEEIANFQFGGLDP